ncbi:DMT family transporter [Peribacillus asahii]|uniref:DMT family transporter n=1 Tax=Peribacillus asahii TaxID=228899 RepID=UPI0037F21668
MGWILVLLAACSEVVGVVGLKKFSQTKNLPNMLLYAGGFIMAFALLYTSFLYLQLSLAYSVWVGLGTAGGVVVNMIFFGESRNRSRIISVVAIIIGVVGLKALS